MDDCLCLLFVYCFLVFFFKQKTAYEMRISDWSSDVCSSDLIQTHAVCCFVPDRRAVRSGAGCCALPAIVAHCAARIAMSRPAPVVGLANRPDPEPASADDGDAGRCAKSSKPFSICYEQDVPGGFCPTVFRHGARYTSGSDRKSVV